MIQQYNIDLYSLEIEIINTDRAAIAEIKSDRVIINEVQDALDLMAECDYRGLLRIHKQGTQGFYL